MAASVFTPPHHPFRPQHDGWVAYHDCGPAVGAAGLAMTWRAADGGLRYAAVMDRARDGEVTAVGRLDERDDLTGHLSQALRSKPPAMSELGTLALILPHRDNPKATPTPSGLPAFDSHVAMARRAVAEATLSPSMRAAFEACLDNGVPVRVPLGELRRRTQRAEWPAMAMAAANPTLARMVLACEPSLMSDADPMSAVRKRWPGLTDAHLRRFQRPDTPPGSGHGLGRSAIEACLDLLSQCPVDWWPRENGWKAFVCCAQTLHAMASACPGKSLRTLAAASGGDWDAFESRLRRAAGVPLGANLAIHGSDCGDPVLTLAHAVLLPLVASRIDEEGLALIQASLAGGQAEGAQAAVVSEAFGAAAGVLYGGKSAPAILETSREWHVRQDAMAAETRGKDGAASWPRLFEGEYAGFDGVTVACIGDYAGLRDEGGSGADGDGVMGLDHCVASRLSECLSGDSHVLSVRLVAGDGSWRRLSTCQVSAGRDDDGHARISIEEHRGQGNEEPDPRAVDAVESLSKAVGAGRVTVSDEALARDRDERDLAALCGYDWSDESALAHAVSTWRPFMPRWARDLAPDELLRSLVERGMIPSATLPELQPPFRA